MDRALYIAMTGAKHNMLQQTSHANNLANANTSGFRADWAQARSMPVFGEHHPTRAYAQVERPATDFNDGPLNPTGNPLDVAIAGDGFLSVLLGDGLEAYTRRGDLWMDPLGQLHNGDGLPVLNADGVPVVLPPHQKVEIGEDGTISIRPLGAGPDELQVVDQLKMVNPDYRDMEKGTHGQFRPYGWQPDDEPLAVAPQVRLVSGFVEGSNVEAVSEMISVLALNRQYEMQIKMMSAADDMSQQSAQLIRIT